MAVPNHREKRVCLDRLSIGKMTALCQYLFYFLQ
jgi:hypothetical protein